jgi:hypothetical protein
VVSVGFEPRILPFTVRCLDHTISEAGENYAVIFGQFKILKLLHVLENSSYRGGWKNKLEKMLWTCRVPLRILLILFGNFFSFVMNVFIIRMSFIINVVFEMCFGFFFLLFTYRNPLLNTFFLRICKEDEGKYTN